MKEELIFHLVKKSNWAENQEKGQYESSDYEEKGYIPCATGDSIEAVANEYFNGTDDLLLLVIDPSRVKSKVRYDEDAEDNTKEAHPRIYGLLNKDAVIDKIPLATDDQGNFEIEVEIS